MKRIKAPIDNKNILEDFTDVFHDGNFVESRKCKEVKQAFYMAGVLLELTYNFGCNYFNIVIHQRLDSMKIVDIIREKVKSMNNDNIEVVYSDCGIDGIYTLSGMFYFVES